MSANKVKKIRTQLSISQRELAERAGTSQQQIQRIEAGKITTSLSLAKAICIALGKPLEVVFPEAGKALHELRDEIQETRQLTDEALSKVSSTGIEVDTRQWQFKVTLNGQPEPLLFPIDAAEKRRLHSLVQGETDDSTVQFIVFHTGFARYALNLSEVSLCQFLHEKPGHVGSNADTGAEEYQEHDVFITMTKGGPSVWMDVPAESSEDETAQLAHILYMIEGGATDASDRYRITDIDGTETFIRAGSVALLQISLSALGEGESDTESDD